MDKGPEPLKGLTTEELEAAKMADGSITVLLRFMATLISAAGGILILVDTVSVSRNQVQTFFTIAAISTLSGVMAKYRLIGLLRKAATAPRDRSQKKATEPLSDLLFQISIFLQTAAAFASLYVLYTAVKGTVFQITP